MLLVSIISTVFTEARRGFLVLGILSAGKNAVGRRARRYDAYEVTR